LEGDKEKMRKLRRLGVAGGAALLAAALIVPAGIANAADTQIVTDQYGAAASGEVLDLHLLGRHIAFGQASVNSTLDAVTGTLNAEATGLGTLLAPATKAVARFNDPAATGGKACALPDINGLIGQAQSAGNLPIVGGLGLGSLLPSIGLNVACGEANVGGNAQQFLAESVGGLLQLHVALPEAVKNLVGTVRSTLAGVTGGTGANGIPVVGDILGGAGAGNLSNVTSSVTNVLSGFLGGVNLPVVGSAGNVLDLKALAPVLNPTQTVDNLLGSLENGDLVRIDLGVATARNAGDLQSYLSQAVAEGGVIDVLPNFLGSDKSLLKITISKSDANVAVDRATGKVVPTADNTILRIESALLPDLGLSSLPIVGNMLGDSGLPVVDSVVPVIGGLLGGVPVADNIVGGLLGFDATVKGLGLKSGQGYVELSPGMSVSLLCDGIVAPLCTEISVGAVHAPEVMPDGRTRIESSTATIHLFKNLDSLGLNGVPVVGPLVGGLKLGTILGGSNDLLGGILAPLTGAAGLNLGEPSDVPGIKISLAHAMAEAGGTKVMGAVQENARELAPVAAAPIAAPTLPRTGGLPIDAAAIPTLLGASAGLRFMVRRRRRNG
jgi:hypothetical protein